MCSRQYSAALHTAAALTVADAILPPVGGVSNGKARCAGVMPSPPFGRTSAQHRANAILRLEKFFPLRGTLFLHLGLRIALSRSMALENQNHEYIRDTKRGNRKSL